MRKSRTSIEVQAIYYIMEGVIYQTPTVQKLIKSRLNKFTHHLNNAFGETYYYYVVLWIFCILIGLLVIQHELVRYTAYADIERDHDLCTSFLLISCGVLSCT